MTEPAPTLPSRSLNGKQRRYLRALAHHLDPVIQVGKDGISPALTAAVQRALTDHELIKVRVLEASPLDRTEVAEPLAQAAGAHVIGSVGRVVMLYRPHPDQPRIELPPVQAVDRDVR